MKKVLSIIMALALAATLFAFAGAVEPYSIGDVSGDGEVLAEDARMALRASAKLEELTEQQRTAADVDGNGDVLADDARIILRVSAKLQKFGEEPVETPDMPSSPADVLKASGIEYGYNSTNKEVYYHFTLKNTGSYYAVSFPQIMVETTGELGGFDFPVTDTVRPGETIEIVGVMPDIDAAPSGVKVTINNATSYDDDGNLIVMTKFAPATDAAAAGALSVSNVHYYDGKITGTIRNSNAYDVSSAAVYVLRINSSGRITAVDGLESQDSPVAGIPAGGNASFELAAEAAVGSNDKIVVCGDGAAADASYGKVTISGKTGAISPFGTLGVVFSATNNDTVNALYSPQFRVAALGAEDSATGERPVLAVGYVAAQVIAPGETLKIVAETCALGKNKGNVRSFSITYAGCAFADKPTAGQKPLTTFDVTVAKSGSGAVLSGYLTNPNSNNLLNVTLCAAVYNESGGLSYVASTVIEEIDKQEAAPFDITLSGTPAKYEISALNWQEVAPTEKK